MSHPSRRRRSWPRTILLLLFAAAALTGIYHCLVRKPELPAALPADGAAAAASAQTAAAQDGGAQERKKDFYTVLVYGVDDDNGGSDTDILVGFDAGSGAIHCVSIPRDSGFYVRGKAAKINSAYNLGGAQLLCSSVGQALGIPVDYYVQVNLKGFVKLVDAIDGVRAKTALIAWCRRRGLAVVTAGAAGGQLDPTRLRVDDLSRTIQDPLLAKVRGQLRKFHGFPRDPKKKFNVPAVFSDEPLRYPEPAQSCEAEPRGPAGLSCAGFGSSVCVTASVGLAAASVALKILGQ